MATARFSDELRKRIRGNQCVYCGQTANSDEHFPPATMSRIGVIMPACKECNVLAGTEWCFDFEMRCQYVKKRLRQKYRKALETPDWAKEELFELHGRLRGICSNWHQRKHLAIERLSWDTAVYIAKIDHNNYLERLKMGSRTLEELAIESANR